MIKEQIKLIHGDCLEVMKAIPDDMGYRLLNDLL